MAWVFTITFFLTSSLGGNLVFASSGYATYDACEAARMGVEQATRDVAHRQPTPTMLWQVSLNCSQWKGLTRMPLPKLPKGDNPR